MVQKLEREKRVLKVGEISDKNDILTIQEKLRAHIGIRTNRSIVMDPWQIYILARRLKAAKIYMSKRIEEENNYYQI